MEIVDRIRAACAAVAAEARHVVIRRERLADYGRSLPVRDLRVEPGEAEHLRSGSRELRAAFFLTLDAINFGSGWFPTLRKEDGDSGYKTIARALKRQFEEQGAWSAAELAAIDRAEVAAALRQDPAHELIGLYAEALRALGRHVDGEYAGSFGGVVDAAEPSAVRLVEILAGWESFHDVSEYRGREVPFYKRAQITASDLAGAGVAAFDDLDRLTLFADNLVPHVLRLDGVLEFDAELVRRIDAEELLEHGSEEEVEIRACAVHAVELLSAETRVPPRTLDFVLWNRGQDERYKRHPRHRTRTTAY